MAVDDKEELRAVIYTALSEKYAEDDEVEVELSEGEITVTDTSDGEEVTYTIEISEE